MKASVIYSMQLWTVPSSMLPTAYYVLLGPFSLGSSLRHGPSGKAIQTYQPLGNLYRGTTKLHSEFGLQIVRGRSGTMTHFLVSGWLWLVQTVDLPKFHDSGPIATFVVFFPVAPWGWLTVFLLWTELMLSSPLEAKEGLPFKFS